LSTRHIETLKYGALLRVKRKTINSMGLSRLQIQAWVPTDSNNPRVNPNSSSMTLIEGWCSEFLNPLSGQRGSVVQPLPFPVPAIYRIALEEGAVIRQGVELTSPIVGQAPYGASVCVIGRAYTEHPRDHCLERLRLAGNGGWISVRLNRPPPQDRLIVEYVGMSPTFEPQQAGLFHLQAWQKAHANEIVNGSSGNSLDDCLNGTPDGSTMDEEERQNPSSLDVSQPPSVTYTSHPTLLPQSTQDNRCLICLCDDRTSTLVHGETGHIACCLVCARVLQARGDPCPVCRMPIDLVIQHFYA
jgi:Zinc finger, C3HC4 type (RING finger)